MKTNLFISFFFTLTLSFSQSERKVISYIDSINSLASSHYRSNDINQSFNYLLKNVELSESVNDDYGNAQANFLLGNLYQYMGLSNEAAESYSKMLASAKSIDDNYLVASSYLSLGEVYKEFKPADEVILYYKKAIALQEKLSEDNTEDIEKSRNNLALSYKNSGNYKLALEIYNQILDNKSMITERPGVYAVVLDNFAHTLYLSGDFTKLPGLYFQSLKISDLNLLNI